MCWDHEKEEQESGETVGNVEEESDEVEVLSDLRRLHYEVDPLRIETNPEGDDPAGAVLCHGVVVSLTRADHVPACWTKLP